MAGVIDCSRLRQFRTASCPRQTCYKNLERRGEEWRRTCTRAIHVYVRRRRLGVTVCRDRSVEPTTIDHDHALHTRLFIFIFLSMTEDETRPLSSISFLFEKFIANISPSRKFTSNSYRYMLFLRLKILQVFFLLLPSIESKKRFRVRGRSEKRHHNISRTGVEFFAALAATYAKSRVAILALVQPDQSLSVALCARDGRRGAEEGGMLEQELSRAAARDTARNPV